MNTSSKILIVEDEAITALNLRKNLEQNGYIVTGIANTGEQAFRQTEENIPDLILMDIKLDGNIDGISTVKELRSKYDIPIVYLTAHGDESTFNKAQATEPCGYLIKPILQNELFSAIEIALSKHTIERRLKKDHKLMNQIAETSPLPVVVYNRAGSIIYINRQAELLFHYQKKMIMDSVYSPMEWKVVNINGDEINPENSPYNLIKQTKQPIYNFEHILEKPDGKLSYLLVNGFPVFDAYGDVDQVVLNYTDITERKKAEEALVQSEEKFKLLIETMNVGFAMHDKSGVCTYVNAAFCDLIGYTKDEIVGHCLDEFVSDASLKEYYNHLTQQKKGEINSYEIIWQAKNCKEIYSIVSPRQQVDSKGKYTGTFAVITDITDRKNTEQHLQENEKRLKAAQKIGRIGNWSFNCKNGNVFLSDEMYRLLGYNPGEVAPSLDFIKQHIVGNDYDFVEKIFKNAVQYSSEFSVEFKYRQKYGQVRVAQIIVEVLLDNNNKPVSFDGVFRDVTMWKNTEESLQWELLLNKILATVSEALISHSLSFAEISGLILNEAKKLTESEDGFIAEVDGNGNIIVHSFTSFFASFIEYNEEGQCYMFSAEEVKKTGKKGLLAINNKKAYYANEAEATEGEHDGPSAYKNVLSVPANMGKKSVGHIVLANSNRQFNERDLAATKRLADLIALAVNQIRIEKQILSSLNEKETLLKEIHHRVKNNMQIISSLLSLQSEYVIDERDLSLFADSQNRIRSMALVHEKLYRSDDLTKIDFNEYIMSISSELEQFYPGNKTRITVHRNVKNIFLHIDRAIPCALIINELLTNALKHAFIDKDHGKIEITFKQNKNGIYTLIVEDNGIGMPKELNLRNSESLGLLLVNELINQLRGKISIIRKNGTKVILRFHDTELLEEINNTITTDEYLPQLRFYEKILIVEDERITAMNIRRVLEGEGYNVIGVVVSGEEALASIENDVPDLILMDIILEGTIDGVDTARMIQGMHDIPIIFSTANTDNILVRKAMRAAPAGYIKKPIVKEELLATIRQALDKV